MPLYSFDPVEAEIFARRTRTGLPLEERRAARRPRLAPAQRPPRKSAVRPARRAA